MNLGLTNPARLAVAAAASAALLLGGCSSGHDEAAACKDYPDGASAQGVTVIGEFGEKPSVKFDKPLEATELQRHIATSGDGEVTKTGDAISAVISIFSAKTGKLATSQPADLVVGDANIYPAFNAGIECMAVGSRVVTVVPPDQLFGSTGNESLGIGADETVIFVTDLKKITPPPTVQEWTEDIPTVKFDDKGVPTIKLPGKKAPEGLRVKILKQGDGAEVKAGDEITVDYQGLSWKDGKVFDQSYGASPATFATTGVISGFSAAVVGQKVGTQLLVSIPSAYAYAEGSGAALAGQDLVFLIDIQAANSPSPTPSETNS
ncbi:MAG: FKBP-type peptidyl-prolyl cis-trans isomerase [Candidatus Nanopelagicales bacterium]